MPEHLELQHLVELSNVREDGSDISLNLFENRRPLLKRCPFLGLILATMSSLFYSLCSVIVKGLVNVDPMEMTAFRLIGVLLPSIPFVIWKGEPIFPEGKRLMLMFRSFVGATSIMLSFYAFRYMPLADASVIIFSGPVFVSIFAKIFLKEPCGIFNVISIVLTLVGVVLITRPPFIFDNIGINVTNEETSNPWGAVTAFASTLFGAGVFVLLRALKGVHFSVILVNFGCFGLLQAMVVLWLIGAFCIPQCGTDRLLILCLAFMSFSGQFLFTMSLQLEQASPVAIARSFDIVFAFIWQVIFFNEMPNIYSVLGAILVLSSVILVGLRKWALTLPDNSLMKTSLGILAR